MFCKPLLLLQAQTTVIVIYMIESGIILVLIILDFPAVVVNDVVS